MIPEAIAPFDFDHYADEYDQLLEQGLSVSGEGKEYFARGRIAWLKVCMDKLGLNPRRIMDYGCGTGMASVLLREGFHAESVVGVDPSAKLIEMANTRYGTSTIKFQPIQQYRPQEEIDLVYCSGVFHHIPISHRLATARYVWQSLQPGGIFVFWENNPWNPGTRYVMSRIPFDRDAITLSSSEAKKLLRSAGFAILRTDYLFIFPRLLRLLRSLEPLMSRLPFGTQYQVLCQKPLKQKDV
jgi:predicted TPR repeat methyltransferase